MIYQCTECDKKNLDTLAATLHYAGTDHKVTPELPPYPEPLPWECWTCGAEFADGEAADEHRETRDHQVVSGPVPRP